MTQTPTPEQLQDAIEWFCEEISTDRTLDQVLQPHTEAIQFALRFTAKALGEPSDGVCVLGDNFTAKAFAKGFETDAESLFKAMITQLCKECAE